MADGSVSIGRTKQMLEVTEAMCGIVAAFLTGQKEAESGVEVRPYVVKMDRPLSDGAEWGLLARTAGVAMNRLNKGEPIATEEKQLLAEALARVGEMMVAGLNGAGEEAGQEFREVARRFGPETTG